MRYSNSAKGRVFLALAFFGTFGAVGCDSLTAPEVTTQDQVLAIESDQVVSESADDMLGGLDEVGEAPARRTRKFPAE